jgi:hypothetical protein
MSVQIPRTYQRDVAPDTTNIFVSKPLTGELMTDLTRAVAWHAGYCAQGGASWVKGLPPAGDIGGAATYHAEFNTKGYASTDYLPIRLSPNAKLLEVSLLVQVSERDVTDYAGVHVFASTDLTTPLTSFYFDADRITPRVSTAVGSGSSEIVIYSPIRLHTSSGGQNPLGTETDPYIDVEAYAGDVIVLGILQSGVRVIGVTAHEIYALGGN